MLCRVTLGWSASISLDPERAKCGNLCSADMACPEPGRSSEQTVCGADLRKVRTRSDGSSRAAAKAARLHPITCGRSLGNCARGVNTAETFPQGGSVNPGWDDPRFRNAESTSSPRSQALNDFTRRCGNRHVEGAPRSLRTVPLRRAGNFPGRWDLSLASLRGKHLPRLEVGR